MVAATKPTEWDHTLALAMAASAADRFLASVSRVPDLSSEDFTQEGLIAQRAAWPKYDPAKSAPQTYLYQVAYRRMQTIHRSSWRHEQRKRRIREDHQHRANSPSYIACTSGDNPAEIDPADFLERAYLSARRQLPARHEGQQRRGLTAAQRGAIWATLQHYDLTDRAMASMLRSDLVRRRLDLDHAPSTRTIRRILANQKRSSSLHLHRVDASKARLRRLNRTLAEFRRRWAGAEAANNGAAMDYITRQELADRLRITVGQVKASVRRGTLPPPITLSRQNVRWSTAEIDSWLARPFKINAQTQSQANLAVSA